MNNREKLHEIMLVKTMLKFRKLFPKTFGPSKINIILLLSKEQTISNPRFYADYEYTDHGQKVFTIHQLEFDLTWRPLSYFLL